MSAETKKLIETTVTILGMNEQEKTNLLLEILASKPSIIYKIHEGRFSVVMGKISSDRKISQIKVVRTLLNSGLADTKNWVEGKEVIGMPKNGVLFTGLPKEVASSTVQNVKRLCNELGLPSYDVDLKIIKDSELDSFSYNLWRPWI